MSVSPSPPIAGPSRLPMDEERTITLEQRQRMLRSNKKLERVLGASLPSSDLPPSSRTAGVASTCIPRDLPRRRLQRQRTLPIIPSKPAAAFYSEEFIKSTDIITDAPPVAEETDDERLSELRRPVPPILLPQPAEFPKAETNGTESASPVGELVPPQRKGRLRRKSLSIATLDVGHIGSNAGISKSDVETGPLTPARRSLERSGSTSAPRPLPVPPLPRAAAQDITPSSSDTVRPSSSSSTRSSRQGSVRRLPPTPPELALTPVSMPLPLTRSSSIASTSTAHSIATSDASILCDINTNSSTSPPSPTSPCSPLSTLSRRIDVSSSAEILRRKRLRMAKLMRVLGESPPSHLVFGSEDFKPEPSPILEESDEECPPRKRVQASKLGDMVDVVKADSLANCEPSPVEPISPITFAPALVPAHAAASATANISSADYATKRPSLDIKRDSSLPSQVKTQRLVENACWVRQQIGRKRQLVEVHDYGNVVRALREL